MWYNLLINRILEEKFIEKILLSVFVMLLGTIMVACGKEDSTGSQEGAVAKVDAENEKMNQSKSIKVY